MSADSDDNAPNGCDTLDSIVQAGNTDADDVAIQWAQRIRTESVNKFDPFGGLFTGYDRVESLVVAVRGFVADNPPASGGRPITDENTQSQIDRQARLDHPSPGLLYATDTAAHDANDLVLTRFDQDRPLIEVSFHATRSARYRGLAASLDLSDRVRLDFDGGSGLAVDGEFFVESIAHELTDGDTRWVCRLQLSPAVDPGGGADETV